MSRALDDLDPAFLPLALELIARCAEARIPVLIVDTRRTPAEHAANLLNGVSWTKRSKHLDGLAIDVCPYAVYQLHGDDKLQWDGKDPVWARIGAIGERIGLRWGGRWEQRDLGHFELPAQPLTDQKDAGEQRRADHQPAFKAHALCIGCPRAGVHSRQNAAWLRPSPKTGRTAGLAVGRPSRAISSVNDRPGCPRNDDRPPTPYLTLPS